MALFFGTGEYTNTTGTGTYTLKPIANALTFKARLVDGQTITYNVTDGAGTWERTRGVWDETARTLTRATVLYPGTGAISWGAGKKFVLLDGVSGLDFADLNGFALPSQGGTGVPNADTKTITLGGPVVTTGAGTLTLGGNAGSTTINFPSGSHTAVVLDLSQVFTANLGFATDTGLTAVGTNRATALALTKQFNVITSAASGTGVILPDDVTGIPIVVFNNGANTIKVYAVGSDTIDGVGGSTGVSLASGDRCIYLASAAGVYVSALILSTAVTGPGSAVDNNIVAFDGTTGKLLKDSGVLTSNIIVSGGVLGTPSSGIATNLTGLPLTTGVTGILPPANGGTGVDNTGKTITLGGNLITSGAFGTTITVTGTTNSTLPAGTHTLAGLDVVQTWSGNQEFNSGNFILKGSSSGTLVVRPAAAAGTNTLTLPAGTTDFSATGATGAFVKQASAGAAFTVAVPTIGEIAGLGANVGTFLATPSSANLATAVTDETGSGALVFGTSPTIATGTIGFSIADALTAVGTNRGTALALTSQFNIVTSAAAGTGVVLPAGVVGLPIFIFNYGANLIKVYGSGSNTIDTVAGSTGVNLSSGGRCMYICKASGVIISAQLGVISA